MQQYAEQNMQEYAQISKREICNMCMISLSDNLAKRLGSLVEPECQLEVTERVTPTVTARVDRRP